ncbi:transcriptional activator, Rgg/GadR/MutR family protein [Streptococcus pneumoniae]|nr:transcriptional activator, Rgg/GadR/MutR family protein [Streptococcus pneumoniae]
MEQIGKVFRQLRESRNISLRQATGGQFSPSMLSRFETGQSELSVEKHLLRTYIAGSIKSMPILTTNRNIF